MQHLHLQARVNTCVPAPAIAAAARPPAGPFGGDNPRASSLSRRLLFIASTLAGLRAWAAAIAMAIWNLRHVVTTTADIVTDILVILQILPNKVAYILIIPMFLADLAGVLAIFRSFAVPPSDDDDNIDGCTEGDTAAEAPHHAMLPSWAAALRWLLTVSGKAGRLPLALASLIILPLLSLTIHLLSATLFLPWRQAGATFASLDIVKSCELRSLLVALIEAPASIVFTTWAFLAPHKYVVGKYFSSATFFVSLAASMAHMWVGLWDFSGRVLQHRGSFRQAWASFFNVHFDLMTSSIVLFGPKPPRAGPGVVGTVGPPVETVHGLLGLPVETFVGPAGPPVATTQGQVTNASQRDCVLELLP